MVFENGRIGKTRHQSSSGNRRSKIVSKPIQQYLSSLDGKYSRLEYFSSVVVGTSDSGVLLWRRKRRFRSSRNHRKSFGVSEAKNRKSRTSNFKSETR